MTVLRLVAALGVASVLGGCRGDIRTEPPVHLVRNMDNVTRCDPQEPMDLLGGRCQMTPPEGTYSVNQILPDDHLNSEGMVDGAFTSELPMALDRDVLDRGHERYNIYCAPCHGESGYANGVVTVRAPDWAIPSFHDEQRRGYPVGRIYNVITNGFATMPSYAAQIPADDRWAIAAYVRALQISQGAPRDLVPEDIASSQGW